MKKKKKWFNTIYNHCHHDHQASTYQTHHDDDDHHRLHLRMFCCCWFFLLMLFCPIISNRSLVCLFGKTKIEMNKCSIFRTNQTLSSTPFSCSHSLKLSLLLLSSSSISFVCSRMGEHLKIKIRNERKCLNRPGHKHPQAPP